jgi:hypothetical protein
MHTTSQAVLTSFAVVSEADGANSVTIIGLFLVFCEWLGLQQAAARASI